MNPVNSSAPTITPLVTSAVTAASTSIAPASPAENIVHSSGSWLTTIAQALSLESVLAVNAETLSAESVVGVSADTLVFIGSVTKDSALAAMSLVSSVNAFRRCLSEGFVSADVLVALSSGLSAATTLDRVATAGVGIGVGIGHFGYLTGGMVTAAAAVNKASQGDVPGALLSGTKLVASIALTGHPVAMGIVIAADVSYGMYCSYAARFAADDGSSSPSDAFDVGSFKPLNEVLEPLTPQVPGLNPGT